MKIKGLKRYYRKLEQKCQNDFLLDLDFNSWFDLWHTHLDWYGYGDLSWKQRKTHFDYSVKLLRYLNKSISKYQKDFQSFIILDLDDSGQDSINLHTKKPNENNYPIKYQEVAFSFSYKWPLQDLIESYGLSWFYIEDKNMIFVFDKKYGLSLF